MSGSIPVATREISLHRPTGERIGVNVRSYSRKGGEIREDMGGGYRQRISKAPDTFTIVAVMDSIRGVDSAAEINAGERMLLRHRSQAAESIFAMVAQNVNLEVEMDRIGTGSLGRIDCNIEAQLVPLQPGEQEAIEALGTAKLFCWQALKPIPASQNYGTGWGQESRMLRSARRSTWRFSEAGLRGRPDSRVNQRQQLAKPNGSVSEKRRGDSASAKMLRVDRSYPSSRAKIFECLECLE